MAGNLPEVEFVLAWQNYRVGERIRPNGTTRDWLLANGYVKRVDAAPGEAEPGGRPAALTRKAAGKIRDGAKALFG